MNERGVEDDRVEAVAHRVLSDPRRRAVVRTLAAGQGVAMVDELVARLDGDEATDGGQTTRAESIRIGLAHNHLPLMADVGVVEYEEGLVRLTARWRTVAAVDAATKRVVEDRPGTDT